jgi:hypothetical protein
VHYLCERLAHHGICSSRDDEQLDKYLEVRELPARMLRQVIVYDMEGLAQAWTIRGVISLERLREMGREFTCAAHRRCTDGSPARRSQASLVTWPFSSTPRAPPASPRAR